MICELCKGKGWVQGQAPDISTACPACGGKGFIEQTNEEWFVSLSTEEKAEVLYKFYCDGRNDELQRYVSINKKSFVDWLKQPHTLE